jgi:hypothetical protein
MATIQDTWAASTETPEKRTAAAEKFTAGVGSLFPGVTLAGTATDSKRTNDDGTPNQLGLRSDGVQFNAFSSGNVDVPDNSQGAFFTVATPQGGNGGKQEFGMGYVDKDGNYVSATGKLDKDGKIFNGRELTVTIGNKAYDTGSLEELDRSIGKAKDPAARETLTTERALVADAFGKLYKISEAAATAGIIPSALREIKPPAAEGDAPPRVCPPKPFVCGP